MKLPRGHHLPAEELAGQLLMPVLTPDFWNRESPAARRLRQWIHRYHITGLVFQGGHPSEIRFWTDYLQRESRYPLLFAASLEQGLHPPFSAGTSFPHAMAFGAAGDPRLIAAAAEALAREARSLGLHIILGPVLDLADLPANPDVHIRAWHREAKLVAQFGEIFVRTVQERGLACVAKHFPGHGSTQFPNRHNMSTLTKSPGLIQKEDLLPFEAVIREGIRGILVGHLLVDGFNHPASLELEWIQTILRKELKFQGVIFTDFLDAPALQTYFSLEECLFRPIEAGADILLSPPQLPLAHRLLVERLQQDPQFFQQAARAVDRIFQLKKWLHARQPAHSHPYRVFKWISHPNHVGLARQVAEAGFTLVYRGKRFPLAVPDITRVQHFVFSASTEDWRPLWAFSRALERIFEAVTVYYHPTPEGLDRAPSEETILKVISIEVPGTHDSTSIPWHHLQHLLRQFKGGASPVVVVIFGNPHVVQHLKPFRGIDAVFLAYSNATVSQEAAARAIASFTDVNGKLPIQLPPPFHQAIAQPAQRYVLAADTDTPNASRWDFLSRLLEQAIAEQQFPGAICLVAHHGKIVWQQAVGRFDFDPHSRQVQPDTHYDLDTLTGGLATTLAILKLMEEGAILPGDPLAKFYPWLKNTPRGHTTILDLLTHRSGMSHPAPPDRDWPDRFQKIQYLLQQPSPRSTDDTPHPDGLPFMLLGDIVERVSGVSLDCFVRDRIFHPMGLNSFTFTPRETDVPPSTPASDPHSSDRSIPRDPWCRWLGGIAGHAGLFGHARDVAAVGQLLIQKGIYNGNRLFRSPSMEYVTRLAPSPAGWQRVANPTRNSPSYLRNCIGLTGNTGTAIRVHLKHELIVVLLSNFSRSGRPIDEFERLVDRIFRGVLRKIRSFSG
ncbi:MAG: serine hydrolase [Calditrichaeota bacterium]|nr:serine hydrolase [Calditrichota bacterium]